MHETRDGGHYALVRTQIIRYVGHSRETDALGIPDSSGGGGRGGIGSDGRMLSESARNLPTHATGRPQVQQYISPAGSRRKGAVKRFVYV